MEALQVQLRYGPERWSNDLSSHLEGPGRLLALVNKAISKVSPRVEDVSRVIVDEAFTSWPRDQRAEWSLLVRAEPRLECACGS